ncbi:MAG: HEAT repeat domain-containing protein [Deltaproteobacteria bacterium]
MKEAGPARSRRGSTAALRLVAALAVTLGPGALGAPAPGQALSFEGQEARLERELREGVAAQRIVAASELATLSPRAASRLVQRALEDPELEVRRHAADAAAALGLREALATTRSWLDAEDPGLREIAMRTEGALGDAASVPLLARALGDARFSVRAGAADALGQLGLEACAAPLATALEDTDATVRVVAASALGRIPGREATRSLLARSLDPALEVRVAVVEALALRSDMDAAAVVEGRTMAVLVAALADDSTDVRVSAIVGLGRARHTPAEPWLARVLDAAVPGAPRATDETREVRAAIAALGRLEAEVSGAALVRALGRGVAPAAVLDALFALHARSAEPIEREIARALSTPELRGAMPRLLEGLLGLAPLRGSEALTRALLAALEAREAPQALVLRAIGAALAAPVETAGTASAADEDAMVALLAALEDDDTAEAAIEGLERAATRGALDPRAVEALIEAERSDPRVLALLGRLDDARALPTLLAASRGPSGPRRRAALSALARSSHLDGAALREMLASSVAHLGASEPAERLAIRALAARHGDETSMLAVLDALDASAPIDRATALELVVALLARDSGSIRAMGLEARARDRVVLALASVDRELSAAASAAIVAVGAGRVGGLVAEAVARGEADPSLGDPVALARAARASGCTTAPCRALGARGAEQELDLAQAPNALLEDELRFPRSVARSYALLARARRGELDARAAFGLCRLAARREPGVRANAGLALAWLALACEDLDPTLWIAQARSVAVQRAGAEWCLALERGARAARCDARRLALASARCLDTAVDPGLRAACAALATGVAAETAPAPPSAERDALLDVTVLDRGGRPVRGRLVSVRFVDGSTVILSTDSAGRLSLRLDHAVAEAGARPWIEDPFATVLER